MTAADREAEVDAASREDAEFFELEATLARYRAAVSEKELAAIESGAMRVVVVSEFDIIDEYFDERQDVDFEHGRPVVNEEMRCLIALRNALGKPGNPWK